MHFNHVVVAIHGKKCPGADPTHTEQGFLELDEIRRLVTLLHKKSNLEIQRIVIGNARRYYQMLLKLLEEKDFRHMKLFVCPFLGTDESVNDLPGDGEPRVAFSSDVVVPLAQVLRLKNIMSQETAWQIAKNISRGPQGEVLPPEWKTVGWGNVLVLTGRDFAHAVGIESRTGEVYRLRPEKKTQAERVIPILVRGEYHWDRVVFT